MQPNQPHKNNKRPDKGQSLWAFPADYTVVDIETNDAQNDVIEIIEIAALRYRNHQLAARFSTLVRPAHCIGWFITRLTGITDAMVENAAPIELALQQFLDFVGNDIILGYNVNFDVNSLYDNAMHYLGRPFSNDFIDVLRFARRHFIDVPNHKQTTIADHLGIEIVGAHRAEKDCLICNGIYLYLKPLMQLVY